MVRAWYMDSSKEDQRLPHMAKGDKFIDLEEIKKKTGVLYWKIAGVTDCDNDPQLSQIRKERGYNYEDQVNITEQMPEYEKKIKMFYEEHLHTDEEIRLVVDGSGYFDVRDNDKWIRIEMEKGDMIVLPAGIYHRFTLDKKNFIIAKRYFVGEPVWTAHNRSEATDAMPARQQYLSSLVSPTR